jgi:DNA-binding protein YbaB
MDMFKMIKEAAAMRSKLSEMEKTLKAKIIEVSSNGVTVKINAKGDVVDFKLSPDVQKDDLARLEKNILWAIQEALKKSHAVMAEEAKKITGGMNIPGLM